MGEDKSTGDYLSVALNQPKMSSAKQRNPSATKNALLDAARTEFQRAGYEAASTRNIASDAGCNAALINRYFGSKIGLFEAVMEECIDLDPLHGLSPNEMVEALADIALGKADPTGGFNPMVVAIKSSGSEEAQDVIRNKLGNPMVEQLAALIGGKDADQKAGMLLSIVSGMFVGRVSVDADALSAEHDDALRTLLGQAMTAVLLSET
ncbi:MULTISPECIES: TetR/AcrR family transcriptional regulator [unclassified Ruegeria]|uniref:TetR/AcrR family transcriptional regulator n=1 Tax=unclassified Ruegeria TaxID=2625375 RepID=UPI0014877DEF|nr:MULTISPECIES: TetR/AcrR family transcriptional regulator [unclassified Ruegeria]NOD88835.1 TetR family transcriptional regulator [Ruegeria sp. HKCCD4318]NOE14579.1 TetR family transcriptional regulator [Ruegeria sp. HKCCD4318-2]NOG09900.1 TetR/AcrR family transcriptional regulator [Ruegeria sp. HKCCD4315]